MDHVWQLTSNNWLRLAPLFALIILREARGCTLLLAAIIPCYSVTICHINNIKWKYSIHYLTAVQLWRLQLWNGIISHFNLFIMYLHKWIHVYPAWLGARLSGWQASSIIHTEVISKILQIHHRITIINILNTDILSTCMLQRDRFTATTPSNKSQNLQRTLHPHLSRKSGGDQI